MGIVILDYEINEPSDFSDWRIVFDFANISFFFPKEKKGLATGQYVIHPLNGREFQHEYLGKKGDYYQGMLVGEYTLELHQEQAHARIKDLA